MQALVYDVLADCFAAEGVDAQFILLGDGNMHWSARLREKPGSSFFHVRHEHCAIAMAMGYADATGNVGVASITCGPGLTQTITALFSAVRNRSPIVVFAGETPMSARWHNQEFNQTALITACGVRYIQLHSPELIHHHVREAFYHARTRRQPVVIGVPYDLQKKSAPSLGSYQPSTDFVPDLDPIIPEPGKIGRVAELLLQAKRPLFVAGRGANRASAGPAIEALAERCGALLATSLLGKGLFDHNPFNLGVSGGFSTTVGEAMIKSADLVLGFGASLNNYTQDGGQLFANARVVQINAEPDGLRDGLKVADIHLRADAKLAAEQLLSAIGNKAGQANVRSDDLARRIREEPADNYDFADSSNLIDPRRFFERLEKILPRDYDQVSGSGNQGYFHTVMKGIQPGRYHAFREFGAVGNGFPHAMGVAAARRNGRVAVFEGDGGLIMHIQEFETLKRHDLKLLIVCLNDAAYGAEIHRLRHDGLDDSGAIFGRPDFAGVARAFGLRGATVTSLDQIDGLMKEYDAGDSAMVWDVHISDQVIGKPFRSKLKAH